jgi:hypothetical protein
MFTALRRDTFRSAWTALAISGTLLAALAGCMEVTTPAPVTDETAADVQRPALDPTKLLVWGTVTGDGKAEGGVLVSSGGTAATSAGTGFYRIYLPAGPRALEFKKDGFTPVSKAVNGNAGSDVKLNVALASTSGGGGGGGGDQGGGPVGPTFTVRPGQRVERVVSSPGKLSFTMTNVPTVSEDLVAHFAWGYEVGKGWTGGKGGGGAEFGLRTYKLKCYNLGGVYSGSEPRYTYPFARNKSVDVWIEWTESKITTSVGGMVVSVNGRFPKQWVVGLGWPPAIRPGIDGAVFSNIKWPAGSTPR